VQGRAARSSVWMFCILKIRKCVWATVCETQIFFVFPLKTGRAQWGRTPGREAGFRVFFVPVGARGVFSFKTKPSLPQRRAECREFIRKRACKKTLALCRTTPMAVFFACRSRLVPLFSVPNFCVHRVPATWYTVRPSRRLSRSPNKNTQGGSSRPSPCLPATVLAQAGPRCASAACTWSSTILKPRSRGVRGHAGSSANTRAATPVMQQTPAWSSL